VLCTLLTIFLVLAPTLACLAPHTAPEFALDENECTGTEDYGNGDGDGDVHTPSGEGEGGDAEDGEDGNGEGSSSGGGGDDGDGDGEGGSDNGLVPPSNTALLAPDGAVRRSGLRNAHTGGRNWDRLHEREMTVCLASGRHARSSLLTAYGGRGVV